MANKLPSQIFDLNDLTTSSRSVSVLYGRRTDGSLIALEVDDNGILSSNATVTLSSGDIQIGAVEIKDETTDVRANVLPTTIGATSGGGATVNTVLNHPIGSTNSFFTDDSIDAVDDTGWTAIAFGFSSFSITLFNRDATRGMLVSFDAGATTHMILDPGQGFVMDFRRASGIALKSSLAGNLTYRSWAY